MAAQPTPEPEKAPEVAEKQPDKPVPETGAPVMKAIPVQPRDKAMPADVPVMKAIPVEPQDEKPLEIRKAVPAGPLDEVKDQTLLLSATPPPSNNLDQ